MPASDNVLLSQDILQYLFEISITDAAEPYTTSPAIEQELRPLGWTGAVYKATAWTSSWFREQLLPFLHLNKAWRRRALSVLMQRVQINDWNTEYAEGGYNERRRFLEICEPSKNLRDGLSAASHIRHLTYGISDDYTQGCCVWPEIPFWPPELDQAPDVRGQAAMDREMDLAKRTLKAVPDSLASLTWRTPLAIEGDVAEIIASWSRLTDVFICSDEFFPGESVHMQPVVKPRAVF